MRASRPDQINLIGGTDGRRGDGAHLATESAARHDGGGSRRGGAGLPEHRRRRDDFKHYGRSLAIRNATIRYCAGDGLSSERGIGGEQMEAHVSGLVVRDCGGNGIDWRGPHDSTFVNVHVIAAKPRGSACVADFQTRDESERAVLRATEHGTIGFHAATPIEKPTVTGSRGGNVALANLLTALANYGLITNSTTA